MEEVRKWCRDCRTGGGGHGIRKAGGIGANSRGRHVRIQCAKEKQRTETCKWECTFEDTIDGWMLVRANWDHNGHSLHSNAAAVMAARGTAFMPQELMDFGAEVAAAGLFSIKELDQLLRRTAEKRGIDVTWEPQHLRSRFTLPATDDFDLTGLMGLLKQRENESNCGYEVFCDDKGVATHIFVQLDGGMQDWANTTEPVLLFDPTWGTHRGGMKLCCFTTVAASGQTVVLAFAIIIDETPDSILWCFRSFAKHFKKKPVVLFTDDAASIRVAFASMHDAGMWRDTHHFLCTFHLAKNFFKHVHPVVRDTEHWNKLNSWFWLFAKYSDSRFEPEIEWDAFMQYFDAHSSGSTKGDVTLWLGQLWDRRGQWMAVYTWKIPSLGVHSTQRAEAVHSAIKKRKLKNVSVIKLVEELTEYNEHVRSRREVDDVRKHLRQVASVCNLPGFMQILQPLLSPFAFELVSAQFARAIQYKSTPADEDSFLVVHNGASSVTRDLVPVLNDDGTVTSWQCNLDFGLGDDAHSAGHLTTLKSCTCQFPNVFGLPCAHILCLHIQQQCTSLSFSCSQHWLTKTVDVQQSNLRSLRALTSPLTAASVTNPAAPSFSDRRAVLLDELLPIVDSAARNMDLYHTFRSSLPALRHALERNVILSIPNAAEQSVAPISVQTNLFVQTEDQVRISGLLGTTYVIDGLQPESVDGRMVLVKYGSKVWYLAKVIKELNSYNHEYEVQYSDQAPGLVRLDPQTRWEYTNNTLAPRWSWLLLKEAPLSNVGSHTSIVESAATARGRKAVKRKAPIAGPTSSRKR